MLDVPGNVGEFIGGLGVVVSLVYPAIQIRQNTISPPDPKLQRPD